MTRWTFVALALLAAPPAFAQAPQGAELSRALQFIESRLGEVPTIAGSDVGLWTAKRFRTQGPRWSWTEVQTTAWTRKQMVATTTEDYSTDVSQLAYPVQVSGSDVIFECRSSKCIAVKVQMKIVDLKVEADSDPARSEESRTSNTWHFKTPAEAARVARAMNDAFLALGATKPGY